MFSLRSEKMHRSSCVIGTLSLLPLFLITADGQRSNASQVQRSRTYTNIRQVDFRNFTYRLSAYSEQPSDVQLRNGSHIERDQYSAFTTKLQTVAYGDLTG